MHQSTNSPIPTQSDNNIAPPLPPHIPTQSDNNIAPPVPPIAPPLPLPPPDTCPICLFICMVGLKFIFVLMVLCMVIQSMIVDSAKVESHVVGAALSQFDLNTTNNKLQLDYNLTVDINVKNPNKLVDIYYDKIEVRAFYQGNPFDSVNLMSFYQGHHHKKNKTTSVHPVFQGQTLLAIPLSWENNQYSELIHGFNRDKIDGRFDIEVQLHVKVTYELAQRVQDESKPMCKCDLRRVPLVTYTMHSKSSTSSMSFKCQYSK